MSKRFTIVSIIPPRPGAIRGTIVFDPDESPPVESMSVLKTWLRSTHCRVGGRVSFMPRHRDDDDEHCWLRYHWEELSKDEQQHGVMDDLERSKNAERARRQHEKRAEWNRLRDLRREGSA